MLSHLTHSHNLRVNQSKWNLFHLLNIYKMNQRRKRFHESGICLFVLLYVGGSSTPACELLAASLRYGLVIYKI